MVNLVKQFVIFGNFNNITFNNTTDPIHKLAKELKLQLIVKPDPETQIYGPNGFTNPFRPSLKNEDNSVIITFNVYKVIINTENHGTDSRIKKLKDYVEKIVKFLIENSNCDFIRLGLNGFVALDSALNDKLYNKHFSNATRFEPTKKEWSVRDVLTDNCEEIGEQVNVCYTINKIEEKNYPMPKPVDTDISLAVNYDINTLQNNNKQRFSLDNTLKFFEYANETQSKLIKQIKE